jgi:hypothetical protein
VLVCVELHVSTENGHHQVHLNCTQALGICVDDKIVDNNMWKSNSDVKSRTKSNTLGCHTTELMKLQFFNFFS